MCVTIQKTNTRLVAVSIHVIAWILFAGLMYATRLLVIPHVTITETIASTLPYLLTFYVSLGCYRLLNPQRLALGILVFLLVFIILSAIAYLYYYWLTPMSGVVLYTTTDIGYFLSQATWGFIYMFGAATICHIVPVLIRRERELRIAESEALRQQLEIARLREQDLKTQREKLQFENAFIRAQINPHFLHNALNAFIEDAYPYSEALSKNIRSLSTILQYAMKSSDFENDKVALTKELQMLQALLNIHHMRYPDNDPIKLEITGKPGRHLVPPMLLLTLVENALKYGKLDDPNEPVTIRVLLQNGSFTFTVENAKIPNHSQHLIETSSHIGLKNVRYRLQAAFNERYSLKIDETETNFIVTLTILEPV